MASVWKRLQRVNKRAAKFQYTAVYHRIDLETTPKWKPNKLSVVWTRRSRRVVSEPQEWEPSLKDPLRGSANFTVPENQTVAVTLFKDSRTNELEDKDWTFVLEDVSPTGKRRRLASTQINMRRYATLEPSQRLLLLHFEPNTTKIVLASMQLTLHCVLLREGQATDEDMQSLASLLSVNNNSDIAVLEDLDEDDYNNTLSDHSTRQVFDLRQQMEEMTHSLTNSDLCTPNSVQSLNFDSRTPTGPATPATPTQPTTPVNTVDGNATTQFRDLKITEEKDKERPKSRPEFLSSLTKLALKEPAKITTSPKAVLPTNNEPGIKGITFKANAVVKSDTPSDGTDIDESCNDTTEATIVNEARSLPEEGGSVNEDGNSVKEGSCNEDSGSENLKPLELKTNLNSISLDKNDNEESDADRTPTADRLQPLLHRDKTPVQDLLEWCQSVTREYKSCKVTNLTTSFRSGLAFCAIIHRYRPDLIDFSGLQPDDAERNIRVALEASATLGISQVLTAADVCTRPTPDRLAIMTYLFQLRAHFTGNELQVEQLGNDEAESSYLVGRHDTDGSLPPELFSREVSTRRSRNLENRPRPVSQSSQDSRNSQERSTPDKVTSPLALKEPRDSFLHQSKTVLNKFLSSPAGRAQPTAKWFAGPAKVPETPPPKPQRLMTRKELTDPFGSDEEDEQAPSSGRNGQSDGIPSPDHSKPEQPPQSPQLDPLGVLQPQPDDGNQNRDSTQPDKPKPITPELPKPTPQLLSRHDELKERARLLLEQTKKEAREKARKQKEKEDSIKNEALNGVTNGDISPSKKPVTEEERQAILRERARKLIADARAGVISPTSPLSPARARGGTVEIISERAVMEEIAAAGGLEQMDALLGRSDSLHSNTPPRSEDQNSEDTRSVKSGSVEGEERGRGEERVKGEEGSPNKRTPLQSFSAIIERLTPDKENIEQDQETGSYIACELEALEREQRAVDERAAALERQLRGVMGSRGGTQEENRLMSQWFNLVNKKNALLRRQMQLNILEQEEDLSRRCELLARELRLSLGVEEWRKTPGQRRRERLLLQELVTAVNERDRLVQEMDEQEKAIAEDAEIEHDLSQVEMQRKNNCILQ